MRQLTTDERAVLQGAMGESYSILFSQGMLVICECSDVFFEEKFEAGFIAGLEYQDKRIEVLEAQVNQLQAAIDKRNEDVSLADHLLTIAPQFGWQGNINKIGLIKAMRAIRGTSLVEAKDKIEELFIFADNGSAMKRDELEQVTK